VVIRPDPAEVSTQFTAAVEFDGDGIAVITPGTGMQVMEIVAELTRQGIPVRVTDDGTRIRWPVNADVIQVREDTIPVRTTDDDGLPVIAWIVVSTSGEPFELHIPLCTARALLTSLPDALNGDAPSYPRRPCLPERVSVAVLPEEERPAKPQLIPEHLYRHLTERSAPFGAATLYQVLVTCAETGVTELVIDDLIADPRHRYLACRADVSLAVGFLEGEWLRVETRAAGGEHWAPLQFGHPYKPTQHP
jgi:hypothetical protein